MDGIAQEYTDAAVYLHPADKYHRLTR
jgi:hypothetical protein